MANTNSQVRRKVRESAEREMASVRRRADNEIERLDKVFDRFRTLKVQDLEGDELLYREMKNWFGKYFEGHMGATAIQKRLETFDLEYDVLAFNEKLPRVRIIPIDEFDPLDPFRSDGCSYVNPSVCTNVANLLALQPDEPVKRNLVDVHGGGAFRGLFVARPLHAATQFLDAIVGHAGKGRCQAGDLVHDLRRVRVVHRVAEGVGQRHRQHHRNIGQRCTHAERHATERRGRALFHVAGQRHARRSHRRRRRSSEHPHH